MSNTLTANDVETLAKRYGLSIASLCKAAGVSLSAFYHWRSGDGDIYLATYDRLLTAVGKAKEGTGENG